MSCSTQGLYNVTPSNIFQDFFYQKDFFYITVAFKVYLLLRSYKGDTFHSVYLTCLFNNFFFHGIISKSQRAFLGNFPFSTVHLVT